MRKSPTIIREKARYQAIFIIRHQAVFMIRLEVIWVFFLIYFYIFKYLTINTF